MDKYITNFDTTSQLQSFSATTEFKTPHVSHTEDTDINHYFYDPYTSHDYVNIGGVRWATMNAGATAVTDTGLYFQWGDTSGYTAAQVGSGTGKKYFGWADYKYGNGTSSPGDTGITKYNATDGMTMLRNEDNSAYAGFGGLWRMPTTEEFVALGNAVNTAWTESYQGSGVAGLVCTDKTDSSKVLFFPAAGRCYGGSVNNVGSYGVCWSSSLGINYVQNAYRLFFNSNSANWESLNTRCNGFPVRPVMVFRKQFPDITVLPSAKTGLVYNGSAQILLSGGTASVPGTFTYGSGTNAGTYDATWTFTPTDVENYNVVTGTTSATISKASRTLSWTTAPSDFNKNQTITIAASASVGDGTITYSSSNSSIASVDGNVVSGVSSGSCTITASITECDNYNAASVSSTINVIYDKYNGHAYVDLGLPSGTKWATMNVGATATAGTASYGNYYKYGSGATPYVNDNNYYTGTENPLSLEKDTARQVMGGEWHMPTLAQFNELRNYCTFNTITINGLIYLVFSNHGQSMYLPIPGYYENNTITYRNDTTYYLGSTPDGVGYFYSFYVDRGNSCYTTTMFSTFGFPVRGVIE